MTKGPPHISGTLSRAGKKFKNFDKYISDRTLILRPLSCILRLSETSGCKQNSGCVVLSGPEVLDVVRSGPEVIKICCTIRIRIRQEGFCISAAICAFLVRRTIKIFSRVKLKKRIYLGKRIYSRPVLV